MFKTYLFPEKYQEKIEQALLSFGHSLANPQKIAESVLKLSDHYQQQSKVTPWKNKDFCAAYLAYYFPLNYLRNLKVFDEALQIQFPRTFESVVDFGMGLGSSYFAAKDSSFLQDAHYYGLDSTSIPLEILQRFFAVNDIRPAWKPQLAPQSLGIFSYSLNELPKPPDWFFQLKHILILEPSTQEWGRKLAELRAPLKQAGYSLWAPCTHQQGCPLLIHSRKDWCHDRLHWKAPDWFLNIESHLPIKNKTLTYSYLLASKEPAPAQKPGRIVGDELHEKGKTRWLYCRGEDREFLAWLHKQGPPPDWHRGELINYDGFEKKSNELRVVKS